MTTEVNNTMPTFPLYSYNQHGCTCVFFEVGDFGLQDVWLFKPSDLLYGLYYVTEILHMMVHKTTSAFIVSIHI